MTNTFRVLAVLLSLCVVAAIGAGLWSFLTPLADAETKYRASLLHFELGLTTALGMLLVHCLIFMYFLGTGRWVKEVTIAYKMPDEPLHKRTRELKRKAFPAALFSMLIGIATAVSGSGVKLGDFHWSVHWTLAGLTVLINLWAFRVEYRCVSENAEVLRQVLVEVDKIRLAMGLDTNAEALARDESDARDAHARR